MRIPRSIAVLLIAIALVVVGFAFEQSVTVGLQTLTLFGVLAAVWTVLQAKTDLRAQTVMKLTDEWRSIEAYYVMKYINDLEIEWKKSCIPANSRQWELPAKKWVDDHLDLEDPKQKEEWDKRRTAAQLLSKMGLMAISGYLSWDDLFGVIPEMGRYLAVLIPIERAILQHWYTKETERIADWDVPVAKPEFPRIFKEYIKWQKRKNWQKRLSLEEPDYSWSVKPSR